MNQFLLWFKTDSNLPREKIENTGQKLLLLLQVLCKMNSDCKGFNFNPNSSAGDSCSLVSSYLQGKEKLREVQRLQSGIFRSLKIIYLFSFKVGKTLLLKFRIWAQKSPTGILCSRFSTKPVLDGFDQLLCFFSSVLSHAKQRNDVTKYEKHSNRKIKQKC